MAIEFQHSLDVSVAPERAFAVLDDFSQTPKWLARCTGIEKLSPGENTVGTKLRYAYKEGGRTGTMDGEIAARVPSERFSMHYADAMMDVTVDFRIAKTDAGSRLTHAISITPRTFFMKLFSPLIRRQIPKQTVTAMESLRELLQTPS